MNIKEQLLDGWKRLWPRVRPIVTNKYVLVFAFIIVILLLSSNETGTRWSNSKKIKALEKEIEYYNQAIEQCNEQYRQVTSSDEELIRFARERYKMKAPDEDVFIIEEK